jgi:uroporphyrinogen decarboxylase
MGSPEAASQLERQATTASRQNVPEHLLLRAIRGDPVERPPVWAMRQAGRWDPEFRRIRADRPFFDFTEDVNSAVQATLCPRRFGVDAIILFYDITTLPVAMGLPFTLQSGAGPVPEQPVRTMADVRRLNPEPPPSHYGHVLELLRRVKTVLGGQLPVIAFAGAPFTVATYCIGTGKDLSQTRCFIREQPKTWEELLQRLQHATIRFLRTLIEAGADVYQVFDSWAGMLNATEYEAWAQPHHQAIFAGVRQAPAILFVKECPYLDLMCACGANVISLGTRHDLQAALRRYPHLAFQGNVDFRLLREGTPEEVRRAVWRCLDASGGQRHIVNLNHGLDKDTPVANFAAYVQAVQEWRRAPEAHCAP